MSVTVSGSAIGVRRCRRGAGALPQIRAIVVCLIGLTLLVLSLLTATSAHAQTSASAYTTGYRWDAARRLVGQISAPADAAAPGTGPYLAARYWYNADGQLVKAEDGRLLAWQAQTVAPSAWGSSFTVNKTLEIFYDTAGRPYKTTVKGSDGVVASVSQLNYDDRDHPICSTVRMNPSIFAALPTDACALGSTSGYGADRITKNIYDTAGQLTQVRKAFGVTVANGFPATLEQAYTTYEYTANGKQKYVIDAGGNKAELKYDGFDRQIAWIFPSKTTVGALATCNLGTVTEVSGLTGPNGVFVSTDDCEKYFYDRGGNRGKFAKRDGSVLAYTFDAVNRMTVKVVPDTRSQVGAPYPLSTTHTADVYYGYDLRGLMTEARFVSGSGQGLHTTYDKVGRITDNWVSLDGATGRVLRSCYDANGNRTRLGYPDLSPATAACTATWTNYIGYDYDGLNRSRYIKANDTQITLMDYRYNANTGYLDQEYVGNSAWGLTAWYRDPVGRVNGLQRNLYGTTTDFVEQYASNPAGQVYYRTMDNDAYAYTARYAVNRPYVANGLNQYTAIGPSGNQLAVCHDANGNLTYDGMYTYIYDVENRLVEKRSKVNMAQACPTIAADYNGTLQVMLRYDPMGRLYETTGATTGLRRYLHDGDAMIAEYNGTSGAMLQRYVHGADAKADDPVAFYQGATMNNATLWFLHRDRQGSINATADTYGNPTRLFKYDEYGVPQSGDGSALSPENGARFGYTGQAWIPDLGMYYYKARVYSPTLGRFMQTDPIGYRDQMNLYAYVGNDPTNRSDPSGMNSDKGFERMAKGLAKANAKSGNSKTSLQAAGTATNVVSNGANAARATPSRVTVDSRGTVRTGGAQGRPFNGNQHVSATAVSGAAARVARVAGPVATVADAANQVAGGKPVSEATANAVGKSVALAGVGAAVAAAGPETGGVSIVLGVGVSVAVDVWKGDEIGEAAEQMFEGIRDGPAAPADSRIGTETGCMPTYGQGC